MDFLSLRRREIESNSSPSPLVLFMYSLFEDFTTELRSRLVALVFKILMASDLAIGI